MDWFKKHTDTVIILGAFAASIFWMNGRFNEVDNRFSKIEQDMAVMKAVLIMRNVMPKELAQSE